jgi:hypothetical protein
MRKRQGMDPDEAGVADDVPEAWGGNRSIETTDKRSDLIRRVRQKGTSLELAVRSFLHANGIRYFLNG